jgi:hypothetical protein
MNTTRLLKTAEEAAAILEYFNGFHDGFIKRLTLNSFDYFESRGVQACSGRLDLELVIAHYNYRNGNLPRTRSSRRASRMSGICRPTCRAGPPSGRS